MLIIALLIILYLGEYMKYFVSADVHGFFDEWIYALEEKRFNMDNPEHMLIVCGDLFDRGNQAKELQAHLQYLRRHDSRSRLEHRHYCR